MRFFQVTQISFKLISIKSQTLYHNGSFAVWRTTLANSFDLQEHVLPSALDMEVNMVADMEVDMVADMGMDMVDDKEVHKMMNDVTKDIVGE